MKNKKEEFKESDLTKGFNSFAYDSSSWLMALALITGLFTDKGKDKKEDMETRVSKLEAKIDLIEKILLD